MAPLSCCNAGSSPGHCLPGHGALPVYCWSLFPSCFHLVVTPLLHLFVFIYLFYFVLPFLIFRSPSPSLPPSFPVLLFCIIFFALCFIVYFLLHFRSFIIYSLFVSSAHCLNVSSSSVLEFLYACSGSCLSLNSYLFVLSRFDIELPVFMFFLSLTLNSYMSFSSLI